LAKSIFGIGSLSKTNRFLKSFKANEPSSSKKTAISSVQDKKGKGIETKKTIFSNLTPLSTELSKKEAKQLAKQQQLPLNTEELKLLKTLSTWIKKESEGEEIHIPPEQKKEWANLFIKSIGNKAINQQLTQLIQDKKLDKLGIISELALIVKEFAFLTKGADQAYEIAKKAEVLMEKINKQEPIANENKLSLEEIGQLDSLCEASEGMQLLQNLGLHEIDPALQALVENFKKSERIHSQIEFKLNKYSNYKAGDLIFQDQTKLLRFRQVDQLDGKVSEVLDLSLHHAAICVKGKENTDQISHVLNGAEKEDFLLQDKATTSGYRLDPTRLLNKDPEFLALINTIYLKEGKDASTEIQTMYQTIQSTMHSASEEHLKSSLNKGSNQSLSGLSQLFKGLNRGQEKKGHFTALLQKILPGSDIKSQKILSSEFVAKSIIAALLEQEDMLFNKILDYLATDGNMSTSEARTFLAQKQIFNLDIPKDQASSEITPMTLLKILTNQGCLDRVAPSPLLQQFIQSNDLDVSKKETVINTQTITGYKPDEALLERMKPDTYQPNVVVSHLPTRILPENPTLDNKWSNMENIYFKAEMAKVKEAGKLYPLILERRDQIKALKEEWRLKMEEQPSSEFKQEILQAQATGQLTPISGGMGGAYLFASQERAPLFIIKPSDEDILALNNRKIIASPFNGANSKNRVRAGIPLYTTVQTEVLAYQIAEQLGFTAITPKTEMVILNNNAFHDLTDTTQEAKGANSKDFFNQVGRADKEKLCSVQEFVSNSEELSDFFQNIAKKVVENDLTDTQENYLVENLIDQKDVEECVLFNCITGETDGNLGNFRIYVKDDIEGNKKYGIKKIDNALCFPEGNKEFSNCLSILPHIDQKLSAEGTQRLLDISAEQVIMTMQYYGKTEKAINSFIKRLDLLKKLAVKDNLTLRELDESIEKMQDVRQVKLDKAKAQALKAKGAVRPQSVIMTSLTQSNSNKAVSKTRKVKFDENDYNTVQYSIVKKNHQQL
jgi:hypothetical protein